MAMVTATDVQGILRRITSASCDREGECSDCGRRLRERGHAWAGDAGIYCTKRCGQSHAAFLADEMNRRRAADIKA